MRFLGCDRVYACPETMGAHQNEFALDVRSLLMDAWFLASFNPNQPID